MNMSYRCGLVVGKFCPLHLGHELVIGAALERCDEVVVISYTKPGFAGYGRERREAWLAARFPTTLRLVIDDASLAAHRAALGIADGPEIPPDDAPDDVQRKFVAWLCMHLLRKPVDCVFTSEDYGDGFAAVLGACLGRPVHHACVDKARAAIPISGTRLRADPHGHRQHLSPEVYRSFVRRVCLLGGESSGKTSLAQALAQALDTRWVAEYGRELWDEKNGQLSFADMAHIGVVQVEREEGLAQAANRWLICDTSPLTTLFYSQAMFSRVAPELARLAERRYDLVFLCAPDFDFVQDGTRRDDAFRQRQHRWYQDVLDGSRVPYVILAGMLRQRLDAALSRIGEMESSAAMGLTGFVEMEA